MCRSLRLQGAPSPVSAVMSHLLLKRMQTHSSLSLPLGIVGRNKQKLVLGLCLEYKLCSVKFGVPFRNDREVTSVRGKMMMMIAIMLPCGLGTVQQ